MSHIPEITYVFYLVISIPLAVFLGVVTVPGDSS